MNTANSLHPLFQGLIQSFVDAPRIVERVTYETALRTHDWSHEFSDDGGVYRRGRAELESLREQQRRIDPDFAIWDSLCPEQCRGGRSYA